MTAATAQDSSESESTGDGGLRRRLIDCALDILASDGVEALTLRAVARAAGVSHAAPARHFRNMAELEAEVAAEGYRRLATEIHRAQAVKPAPVDPVARLKDASEAYVGIALENPALFSLLLRVGEPEQSNVSLSKWSHRSFAGFLGYVEAAQEAGWRHDEDSERLAAGIWAATHGLAVLWLHGAYQQASPATSLRDALDVMLFAG